MKYVFYGQCNALDHKPNVYKNPYDYSITMYDIKTEKETTWRAFHTKEDIGEHLSVGQKIIIDGEKLTVTEIAYNLDKDCYNVYTSKVLMETVVGMSREAAVLQVNQMEYQNRSFWRKLKDKF